MTRTFQPLLLALVLVLVGCGAHAVPSEVRGARTLPHARSPATSTVVLHIEADSSLMSVTERLAAAFERQNPTVDVHVALAGPPGLMTVKDHAADVVVKEHLALPAGEDSSADEGAVHVGSTEVVLAAHPSEQGSLRQIMDDPRLRVATCRLMLTCGIAAQRAIERIGVSAVAVTEVADARAALSSMRSDPTMKAVVYASDVVSHGHASIRVIRFPQERRITVDVVASRRRSVDTAAVSLAFLSFAGSAAGHGVMLAAGFR